MFTPLVALALGTGTFAQSVNNTYLAGLAQALTGAGLTQLATVASGINQTSEGQALLSALPNGNYTIFAPSDAAFKAASSSASNATALAETLSYHVVPGDFSNGAATSPNHTIARTALNATSLVSLEGNKSQVVAWTKTGNSTVVLNQKTNVTTGNTTSYQNLKLITIDSVLTPPGTLSQTLTANKLTAVTGILSNVSGLVSILENTRGLTFFAPNDAAISAASSSLASLASNQTLLTTVLQNHLINGTTAYSPLLTGVNYTSAAGEPISSITNSSGSYVTSGNAVAKIVQSDVLAKNGVVHIIDSVFADTSSNPSAASSAFQSATSAAAVASTQTGPITAPTSSSSSSSGSHKNGAVQLAPCRGLAVAALFMLAGGTIIFV